MVGDNRLKMKQVNISTEFYKLIIAKNTLNQLLLSAINWDTEQPLLQMDGRVD